MQKQVISPMATHTCDDYFRKNTGERGRAGVGAQL